MASSPPRPDLLAALFDYAGVFPPAEHSVAEATARYLAAKASPDGWLLGPMLLRASQYEELAVADLPLGLIADATIEPGSAAQVERRAGAREAAGVIDHLVAVAPVVYLESPDPEDLAYLDAIEAARADGRDVRAKIRTGGATAAAFPSTRTVAGFIRSCVERSIPFKATAGLHHPVRTTSEVPGATEHGFINMLAAVRCALSDQPGFTEACLEETDPGAFDLGSATWSGVGAGVPDGDIRRIFRSIGSCSFDEPASYLRDLGIID